MCPDSMCCLRRLSEIPGVDHMNVRVHCRSAILFFMSLALTCVLSVSFSERVMAEGTVEEITFAVTDIEGLEELQRDFGEFRELLEKEIGKKVKFFPLSSRTLVVEALRSQKVDFVLTGPSEYIVIRTKAQAVPLVRFSRPDYFSCLVVKK